MATKVKDNQLEDAYIKANGTRSFTNDQSMGGNKLKDLAPPVDANDAVRKIDLDTNTSEIDISALYPKQYFAEIPFLDMLNEIESGFVLPADGRSNFIITTNLSDYDIYTVPGFNLPLNQDHLFNGKLFFIDNKSSENISLFHNNQDVEVPFIFSDEQNFVLKSKDKIIFQYSENNGLVYVGEIQSLQSFFDASNERASINTVDVDGNKDWSVLIKNAQTEATQQSIISLSTQSSSLLNTFGAGATRFSAHIMLSGGSLTIGEGYGFAITQLNFVQPTTNTLWRIPAKPTSGTYTVAGMDDVALKEDLSNKATTLTNPNNTTYPTTQAVSQAIAYVEPEILSAINGNVLLFDKPKQLGAYNDPVASSVDFFTDTSNKRGIILKMYHQSPTVPTFFLRNTTVIPNVVSTTSYVNIGGKPYSTTLLNIICFEFVDDTRIEYWIIN